MSGRHLGMKDPLQGQSRSSGKAGEAAPGEWDIASQANAGHRSTGGLIPVVAGRCPSCDPRSSAAVATRCMKSTYGRAISGQGQDRRKMETQRLLHIRDYLNVLN